MLLQVLYLFLSILGLYLGAEFTLSSAEKIGRYFGLSPLVIGLLIVGFGTSLPELFVSQLAAYRGHPAMAVGNIVGSNVANLLLILGFSGILIRLFITGKELREQFYWHLGLTLLLIPVLLFKLLNPWTTLVLEGFFIAYLVRTFIDMRSERHLRSLSLEEVEEHPPAKAQDFALLILGFAMLYGAGELLVSSGTTLGTQAGISEYFISAVFVAFGTSFPELVTSLLACFKKKNTDLIIGNIIGSNIFNGSMILGSLGFYNLKIEKDFHFEVAILLVSAIFLLALNFFKKNFSRVAGLFFFGCYLATVYFWARAEG